MGASRQGAQAFAAPHVSLAEDVRAFSTACAADTGAADPEARCVFVRRLDRSVYGSISDLVSVSSPCAEVLLSMPQALPVASVREFSDCPPKEKADAGSRSGRIMTRGLRSHSIADYRKWHDTDASMFIWLAGRALCLEHSRLRKRPHH